MNDLYKQAVLDANKVMKISEERAKGMFMTEFSPKIKNMLTNLINEQVSAGSDQPGGYGEDVDKDAIVGGTDINKSGKGSKDIKEEEELDIDGIEDEDSLDEELDLEDEDGDLEDIDEVDLEDNDEEEIADDEEIYENEDDLDVDLEDDEDKDEVLEIVDDEEDLDDLDQIPSKPEPGLNENRKLRKQLKIQLKKNRILAETINTLQKKFNKVDLFNAKLAYAFKLMHTPGLTKHLKEQIAEQFDSAKTLREAKLIYKTIKRSLANTEVKTKTAKELLENRNLKSVASQSTQSNNRMIELAGLG